MPSRSIILSCAAVVTSLHLNASPVQAEDKTKDRSLEYSDSMGIVLLRPLDACKTQQLILNIGDQSMRFSGESSQTLKGRTETRIVAGNFNVIDHCDFRQTQRAAWLETAVVTTQELTAAFVDNQGYPGTGDAMVQLSTCGDYEYTQGISALSREGFSFTVEQIFDDGRLTDVLYPEPGTVEPLTKVKDCALGTEHTFGKGAVTLQGVTPLAHLGGYYGPVLGYSDLAFDLTITALDPGETSSQLVTQSHVLEWDDGVVAHFEDEQDPDHLFTGRTDTTTYSQLSLTGSITIDGEELPISEMQVASQRIVQRDLRSKTTTSE